MSISVLRNIFFSSLMVHQNKQERLSLGNFSGLSRMNLKLLSRTNTLAYYANASLLVRKKKIMKSTLAACTLFHRKIILRQSYLTVKSTNKRGCKTELLARARFTTQCFRHNLRTGPIGWSVILQ
jgi:hypothetical protein